MTSDLGGSPRVVKRINLATTSITEIIPAKDFPQVVQPIKLINEHTSALKVKLYATYDGTDTITWYDEVPAESTVTLEEPEFIGQNMSLQAQCDTGTHITITAIVRGSFSQR
jgi:hypothetical protein